MSETSVTDLALLGGLAIGGYFLLQLLLKPKETGYGLGAAGGGLFVGASQFTQGISTGLIETTPGLNLFFPTRNTLQRVLEKGRTWTW